LRRKGAVLQYGIFAAQVEGGDARACTAFEPGEGGPGEFPLFALFGPD